MFVNKLSALLALAFCAASASANYMRTVDCTSHVLATQAAADGNPLVVKPNTVYVIDKSSDTEETDEYLTVQCPQPKNGITRNKGFFFYISFYYGFNESDVYVCTSLLPTHPPTHPPINPPTHPPTHLYHR